MNPRKQDMAEANRRALDRLLHVRPAWTAVRSAADALRLPEMTLLHAGPPLLDACRPPPPLLASAQLCCLHEGWGSDMQQAHALIAGGAVRLAPAQDYGAVTPLAAVISPSTTLVEVRDLDSDARAWSLLGSGAGPQIRFGSRDPAILPRLRWRDGPLAQSLAMALQEDPIELIPLARAGLLGGDDLHARTSEANAALCAQILPRLTGHAPPEVATMLSNTPLFFLTLWMAASHLMLNAAAAHGMDPASTLVVALAGNGEQCGIRLAGCPSRWFTAPATAPAGPRLNPGLQAKASPVIGDSGSIDALGFGAQALAFAPEIHTALADFLPPDWRKRPMPLLEVHPGFGIPNLRLGLDAAQIGVQDESPLAAIAMIDSSGEHGLLGRGIYTPPASLFQQAVGQAFSDDDMTHQHQLARFE